MVKKINYFGYNFTMVFRHRWDKQNSVGYNDFKGILEISLWKRSSKAVAKKHLSNPKKWSKNLVSHNMYGITFLVFKFWINIYKNN
jgi:hypothetical protein